MVTAIIIVGIGRTTDRAEQILIAKKFRELIGGRRRRVLFSDRGRLVAALVLMIIDFVEAAGDGD